MPFKLKRLRIREISFVDKGAGGDETDRCRVVLMKRHNQEKAMTVEEILAKLPEEDRNVILAALQAAATPAAPAPAVPVPPKQDEPPKPPEPPKPDEEKVSDEEDETRKALAAEVEKRQSLEKRIADMEDKEKLGVFQKKAEENLGHLPGMTSPEIAKILKAANENLGAKEFSKLEQTLISCSEAIKRGDLFSELGGSGEGSDDPEIQIEKRARKMHADHPELTYEACYKRVLKADPNLYAKIHQ